jgi:hypothetical protein
MSETDWVDAPGVTWGRVYRSLPHLPRRHGSVFVRQMLVEAPHGISWACVHQFKEHTDLRR